ncbi:MAG TPA: hypothetical protein DCE52_02340 [Rhodobacteraceae bacterium]|nr:hypothetical protein [Paracoccaceae bacterium]
MATRDRILVGGMKRTLTDVANNIAITLTPIVILTGWRALQILIIVFGICKDAAANRARPSAHQNNAVELCVEQVIRMPV